MIARFQPWPSPLSALFLAALLGFVVPAGVHGQAEPDPPPPDASECAVDEIECFARIYLDLTEIRDDLHQDLALYHDEGRRREARERADRRIEELFERYQVEEEVYEEFIRRIGLEQELRDAFEEVVTRLREGGG